MNQAWYVFGNTLQIISALGLHRQAGRKRNSTIAKSAPSDYIHTQCRKRTFWVAYTIDRYLSVVLGRPRHHHDDDIDQDFPDLVNDEDMTADGPSASEPQEDCHVEALVLHAKLAQIIGRTSHDVYATTKHLSTPCRLAAAHRVAADLAAWRAALPHHLGPAIRPKTLAPAFRRQAAALKLAHAHAVMHASRPFLLGHREPGEEGAAAAAAAGSVVEECLGAARTALEAVEGMAGDGECFHAFWWTGYVTFVALAVVYVWGIQRRMMGERERGLGGLGELAERCRGRLAAATVADSPNRRYGVILEELRLEARQLAARGGGGGRTQMEEASCNSALDGDAAVRQSGFDGRENIVLGEVLSEQSDAGLYGMQNPLGDWETADWLDLDSSAFGPFFDFSGSPVL
ncbi:uncharacterized protein CGMCC3_g12489 [Neofusicoccum parvum]|uniref:Uncharacterized protein CGMCC3_g12489 n=1 Tax=Neofusicoccum parvum TaxID=310453 RepID=A0ACB5S7A0_9PEZI|nr:uncharacterized protein CGMCC3_g12489 [Neofusicoccum parvum]